MRRFQYRVVLPIAMGFLALNLFGWDYENNRIVESMGMGWDMGPPMWPYQVVPLFSFAVNVPAYIISQPVLKALNLRTISLDYAVLFPAIVLLWWWVGVLADFGIPGNRRSGRPKLRATALLSVATGLVVVACIIGLGEYRWVRAYWVPHPPVYWAIFLRSAGPMLWCLAFAVALVRVAIRTLRNELPSSTTNLNLFRAILMCFAILCLNATVVAYLDRVITPPIDRNSCQASRLYREGCVHGTVVDETKKPVGHIQVDLIPTFKTGDARWYGTKSEWTDEYGRFNFNSIQSGAYILAVNSFESSSGPDEDLPFGTVYYLAAKDGKGAAPVVVKQPSATNLLPIMVRRLNLVKITVSVLWEDGTRPERSNISLHNIHYWGMISHSKEVGKGSGEIFLPEGFEYEATASVQCDAGKVIEQRESKPDKRIVVTTGSTPPKLEFVLPGRRCVLWRSE